MVAERVGRRVRSTAALMVVTRDVMVESSVVA